MATTTGKLVHTQHCLLPTHMIVCNDRYYSPCSLPKSAPTCCSFTDYVSLLAIVHCALHSYMLVMLQLVILYGLSYSAYCSQLNAQKHTGQILLCCAVLSCAMLCHAVLCCLVLSSPVLSCPVLCCLPCAVLSCFVPSCPVLSCAVLSCAVLSCPVPSCPVLSCAVLSCPVLCCAVLSCPKSQLDQLA